jgi:ribosomal protein S18 acetylase RimI-like enzyme
VIRAATPADADAIAEIEARSWLWAYSDFIDPEAMHEPYTRSGPWSEYIAAGAVRVFDQDGVVVAYAAVEGAQLKALYVDPRAQGAGAGTILLADAEARIRAAGHARAHLFVYADNAHGRAFYERHGWALVGDLLGHGHWRAPGYRYEKALA